MPIELKSENFGEYYYSHDCGIPYERTEHWLNFFDKIAERIIKELEPKSVLDAGCAWGFLVEALRNRGVEAWGIDISEYAISNVHESIKDYCKVGSIVQPFDRKYDLIVNIEVLEHMQQADAAKAIENICLSSDRVLFSSTPFDYAEVTHVNVQAPEYWSKEFALHDFYRDLDFDGSFVTPWTSLFTRQFLSKNQLLTDYERKFWYLQKENVDLRRQIFADQSNNARLETDSEALRLEAQHYRNLMEINSSELTKKLERTKEQLNLMEINSAELTKELERTKEELNLMEINSAELTKELERTKEELNLMEINSAELTKELERTKEELIKQNLLHKQRADIYRGKLLEWNGLWHALQTSRSWKVLKSLGRFTEFPVVSLNLEALDQLADTKSSSEDDTIDLKKKPLIGKSPLEKVIFEPRIEPQSSFIVNDWKFEKLSGIINLEADGSFEVIDFDPQFLLNPLRKKFPDKGNYFLYVNIDSPQSIINLTFYYDVGSGLSEALTNKLTIQTNQVNREVLCFPAGVKKIRFDPSSHPGEFRIIEFRLEKITDGMTLRRAIDSISPNIQTPGDFFRYSMKGVKLLLSGGVRELQQKIFLRDHRHYSQWLNQYGDLTSEMESRMKNNLNGFLYKPVFSILLPTYNTKRKWLLEAVQSVRDQIYPNWELCISDDCSPNPEVRETIKQLAADDERIKYVFREVNGHISANTNNALEIAKGEFVVLLDHDDLLSKDALYQAVKSLQENMYANYIYSDEDKITEQGEQYDPYFKPDWNPDLLLHQNYLSHLSIIRRSVLNEIGGFRIGVEGSQDWDVALRVTRSVPADSIVHIPHVLYHWRAVAGSTAKALDQKEYIQESQYDVLKSHFDALQISVKITLNEVNYWDIDYPIPDPQPLVSIIIPTRNQKCLLKKCVDSILSLTKYRNYEILIVDNRTDEDDAKIYLNSISLNPSVRVLEYDREFNFSGINNYAVSQAKGSLIVFMNNDIEVLTESWLNDMVSLAIREDTGAVGAKLLYPNGTIQHAGVILGVGGVANHAYLGAPAEVVGQMGRARIVQDMSAVTAACLVIEKSKFMKVNGFNEIDLKIAFNDVDFCLKLLEEGYRNVWTPKAVFIHHESVSRGQEDTPEKQARFASEVQYMLDNWKELLENDPAYNPNLSIERADFTVAFPPRVNRV